MNKKQRLITSVAAIVLGLGVLMVSLNSTVMAAQKSAGESAIGTIEGAASIKGVENLDNPDAALAQTVSVVLDIVFGVAVLLVLANLIWGAYLWIMSGGDSGKLQTARSRMIYSVIGLLIVAAAWPITKMIQDLLVGKNENTSIIRLE